jgi:hypothetical protein
MASPISLGSERYGGDVGRWRRRDGRRKKWRLQVLEAGMVLPVPRAKRRAERLSRRGTVRLHLHPTRALQWAGDAKSGLPGRR